MTTQQNDTVTQIVKGMTLAFFATAYADLCEELGHPLRGEIMNQLPPNIDPGAVHAANTLVFDITSKHHTTLDRLYENNNASNVLTPQEWGHYCAMQAMGHGVGLSDYDIALDVPYVEFGHHSFQTDYVVPCMTR